MPIKQEHIRYFFYEPNTNLFIKKDSLHKYWSATEHREKVFVDLTYKAQEAYSADNQKEAQEYLKHLVDKCGFAATDELDKGSKRVIINLKWLVIQEVSVHYSW